MTKSLDIKNLFIVDKDSYDKEKIKDIAHDVIRFAKVSKEGDILLENINLSSEDKIKISLISRFIAHSFANSINEYMTVQDCKKILPNESNEAVGSRLSALVKNGFAFKVKSATYSVYPHKIEPYIMELKNKEGNIKKNKSGNKKGAHSKVGVGKDIQDLINSGYFNSPKTIKETEDQLTQKGCFHNPKVIDKTIRGSFMKNKDILKRLKNTGQGKAKWVYVIKK